MLQQHCQDAIPWDNPLVNALLLAVRGAGPHPDGHGHPETTKNNYTQHDQ